MHGTVFSKMEYKKLLSNNFRCIEVPFAGTGTGTEAYYQQQSNSPDSAGQNYQRGSGFGALTAGTPRAAKPIAKTFLWSVAEKIGRELFVQAALEIGERPKFKNNFKKANSSIFENVKFVTKTLSLTSQKILLL